MLQSRTGIFSADDNVTSAKIPHTLTFVFFDLKIKFSSGSAHY